MCLLRWWSNVKSLPASQAVVKVVVCSRGGGVRQGAKGAENETPYVSIERGREWKGYPPPHWTRGSAQGIRVSKLCNRRGVSRHLWPSLMVLSQTGPGRQGRWPCGGNCQAILLPKGKWQKTWREVGLPLTSALFPQGLSLGMHSSIGYPQVSGQLILFYNP